jgi:hypothetical protein
MPSSAQAGETGENVPVDSERDETPRPGRDRSEPPRPSRTISSSELVKEAKRWEVAVLERLRAIPSSSYDIRENYKVSQGGSTVLLDALLTSDNPFLPHVVVEIKRVSARSVPPRILVDRAVAVLARYRAATGSAAWMWLIVVAPHADGAERERLQLGFDRVTIRGLVVPTVISDVSEIQRIPNVPEGYEEVAKPRRRTG